MVETALLILLLGALLALIVAAIPLFIAVNLLGSDATISRVIVVNLFVGAVAFALSVFVSRYAGIASFVAMIAAYKAFFSLSWPRAFFAWILEGALIALFVVAAILVFGTGALLG